jgi:hypothetical protein
LGETLFAEDFFCEGRFLLLEKATSDPFNRGLTAR